MRIIIAFLVSFAVVGLVVPSVQAYRSFPSVAHPSGRASSQDPWYLSMTGLSGVVVSWSGIGSEASLLDDRTRAGIVLEIVDSYGLTALVDLDEHGRFFIDDLEPGSYALRLRWHGLEVHRHDLSLVGGHAMALEMRVRDTGSGADVAVRPVGTGLDTMAALPQGWQAVDEFDDSLVRDVATCSALQETPHLAAPRYVPIFELDDDTSWSETLEPITLPDAFERRLIVDPDVNVSRLHERDPLGNLGHIQAI